MVKIRSAKKSDIPILVNLDKEANKEIKWWTPLSNADFLNLIEHKNLLFIAVGDKEIIGYLSGKIKKRNVLLENVFVTKEFRKEGIAKNMIRTFSSKWKSPKYKTIQIVCPEKLRDFYAKLGFRVSALVMKRNIKARERN